MLNVAFQGEHGAYSESAALRYFKVKINPIALKTFSDVLESTTNKSTDYSIIPIENSLEGGIGESYDLLYYTKLNVVGEIYYRIKHCLIGLNKIDKIDTVYSHPQALGQCKKFIQSHNLKSIPTYDTAGSVKLIKNLNKRNVGCIASETAAKIFGLPVIKHDIEDYTNNYTRFLILSKSYSHRTGNDKTSIIFSVIHSPGSLYKMIKGFSDRNINLTKIESRPKKHNVGEYNFYVDFEGHIHDQKIKQALDDMKTYSLFLKIIGSYQVTRLT
ncbi:MAG: prephenate dehydratase [Thaumarchaeota archaeon]|nr:prephenate dehydratase [Nitrososphaerota archaeon]MCY3976101.1 prephenate dehydratase [Nitrososphaerota archaeon]